MSLSGASLDEITFLETAEKLGFAKFVERDSKKVRIVVNDIAEEYEVLRMIEFTSDRKRMSVIVRRTSDSQLISFVKGADTAIMPRLLDENDATN